MSREKKRAREGWTNIPITWKTEEGGRQWGSWEGDAEGRGPGAALSMRGQHCLSVPGLGGRLASDRV